MIICIDGPAACGKSTVARKLAKRLGFVHLNTGVFFRAIGLKAAKSGVSLADEVAVANIAKDAHFAFVAVPAPQRSAQLAECQGVPRAGSAVGVEAAGVEFALAVDGDLAQTALHSAEAGRYASEIAVLPQVRAALLAAQRKVVLAESCAGKSFVVEGRDTGTVVFPEAEVKVFLKADLGVRVARRVAELEQGQKRQAVPGSVSVPVVLERDIIARELQERDERDSQRQFAPLKKASDAVEVDTSQIDAEQVVEQILREIERKLGHFIINNTNNKQ